MPCGVIERPCCALRNSAIFASGVRRRLEVGIFAFKFSNAAGELFDPLALRRRLLCERRGSLPCADGACALLGGAA